jgi:hypothetical protein
MAKEEKKKLKPKYKKQKQDFFCSVTLAYVRVNDVPFKIISLVVKHTFYFWDAVITSKF